MRLFNLKQAFAASIVSASVLFVAAPAWADSPVEPVMKHMQRALKKAMRSSDMTEFKAAVTTLHQYADEAGKLQYGRSADARSIYKDGMHELQTDLADVDAAIAKDDLTAAKDVLKQVVTTRNMYHKRLDVDD